MLRSRFTSLSTCLLALAGCNREPPRERVDPEVAVAAVSTQPVCSVTKPEEPDASETGPWWCRDVARQPASEGAVSIPGALSVRAGDHEPSTHGFYGETQHARFCLQNLTGHPVSVIVGALVLRAAAEVPPAERARPLVIASASFEGRVVPVAEGRVEVLVPVGGWSALELNSSSEAAIRYHVAYVQEAEFTALSTTVRASGVSLSFRYPHAPLQSEGPPTP